ncbi:MAG: hypothetical protein CMH22_06470 [Methylophaga sp.]|nr:hypothetical protein [Methylophaga sp.]|tara:strand:+ start:431 stop:1231 length:801 start_codon:yes stop_codon:yes gene_type:complete
MAREQRHDVDYFPHDCNHGRKMFYIETKYGNDGYAVWFKLLERLGSANYHFIDLEETTNWMFIIAFLKVEESTLKEILSDLAKLGAINQNLYENHQIIYSEKLVKSVEDAYKKRKSQPLSIDEILVKTKRKKKQSAAETPQSAAETPKNDTDTPKKTTNPVESIPKEKESKVKDRKGERNARAIPFLKSEYPQRWETDFMMKYSRQIQEPKKFAQDFNDTVDQEGLEFTDKILFARLGKYARNWIQNQDKYSSKNQNNEVKAAPRI